MDTVLQTYEKQRGQTGMLGQAADLMQPDVIKTMRELRDQLRSNFM